MRRASIRMADDGKCLEEARGEEGGAVTLYSSWSPYRLSALASRMGMPLPVHQGAHKPPFRLTNRESKGNGREKGSGEREIRTCVRERRGDNVTLQRGGGR